MLVVFHCISNALLLCNTFFESEKNDRNQSGLNDLFTDLPGYIWILVELESVAIVVVFYEKSKLLSFASCSSFLGIS